MNNGGEQKPKWSFKPEAEVELAKAKKSPKKEVVWTASEFIHHHKSFGWYLLLTIGTALLAGLIYLLTKDEISTFVTIIVGVLFGILASKKPRQLSYRINNEGVFIGEKLYPYSVFKSFAVEPEEAIGTINFMPLKRLMPEISIHFPPEEFNPIIDILSLHLPSEEHKAHGIDKMMKRFRF